jgi:hypothetical protein
MPRKPRQPGEEQIPAWGPGSEMKFIDGMREHRESYIVYRSERQWLEMYIKTHRSSPHSHHQAGVKYAGKKLEVMNCG